MVETTAEATASGGPKKAVEAAWKRVVDHYRSDSVVASWDEAIGRIAREARPAHTPVQIQEIVDRWHALSQTMGVAASAVDVTLTSVFAAFGTKVIGGILNQTPMPRELGGGAETALGKQTFWKDRVRPALRQIAAGLPFLGVAAGTAVGRPARFGLTMIGKGVGWGGEKTARIISRITRGT